MKNKFYFIAIAVGILAFEINTPCAQQPGTEPLLAGVNRNNLLVGVDPLRGRAIRLSGEGLRGYRYVYGLTFDPGTGPGTETLFGVDPYTHELITIDLLAMRGTAVGGVGFLGVHSIAFDPVGRRLFGVNKTNPQPSPPGPADRLIRIDTATGQGALVGELRYANNTRLNEVGGLAFQPNTGILYGVDDSINKLIRIDTTSGICAQVGPLGFEFVGALAFDRATGILYGVDLQTDQLITINFANGQGTSVGSLGFYDVRGIACSSADGVLYGMDASSGQMITIHKQTGRGTEAGPLGFANIRGLAWVPAGSTLYATDDRSQDLVTIEPTTGQGTVVGRLLDAANSNLVYYGVLGLAYDPYGDNLFGTDTFSERLVRIDRSTGRVTPVGLLKDAANRIFYNVVALAFDTHARTLYGVDYNDIENARLIQINPSTGLSTQVGPIIAGSTPVERLRGMIYAPSVQSLVGTGTLEGSTAPRVFTINKDTGRAGIVTTLDFGTVYGLAYNALSGLFGGTTGSHLFQIDHVSGQGSPVGTLGVFDLEGLALDPTENTLYATDFRSDQLFKINPASAQAEVVGPLGFGSVLGLAFDPVSRTLYGSDVNFRQLIRINTTTGHGTLVGPFGASGQLVEGLAFDASSGILYGVDKQSSRLLRIHTGTGLATPVHPFNTVGFPSIEGLEVDAATGILYGTDTLTLQLIEIDKTTGLGTAVGSTGYEVEGLAGRIR